MKAIFLGGVLSEGLRITPRVGPEWVREGPRAFRIPGVPDGPLRLDVQAPGYTSEVVRGIRPAGVTWYLTLVPKR